MKKLRSILIILIISLFFLVPVQASSSEFVKDDYGLLTSSETAELQDLAKSVSAQYNVGVYVRVEDNFDQYSSIEKYAEAIYSQEQLGAGYNGNCVMLVITMSTRKYDILAHGDTANAAFTDYGKEELADAIVSYLHQNNYAGGFKKFIEECGTYLKANAEGNPIDVAGADPQAHAAMMRDIRYGVTFGAAPLIALIVCLIIKSKNKTAGIQQEALNYVPKDGVDITGMQDIFLYRTESVTHINRDHGGGGGTSINSGGFSHSSGSF